MKNIEFCKEYGSFYNYSKGLIETIKPYGYQEEILSELEKDGLISILASRQMGLSTMLCIHLVNWLINNTSERKIVYLISHKLLAGEQLLDNIRRVLKYYMEYNSITTFDRNNKKEIKLSNENHIKLISSTRACDVRTKFNEANDFLNKENLPYALIVDNAAFVNTLSSDVPFFMDNTNVKQIILCSAFNNDINYFYDNIHSQAGDTNSFKAFTYKWNLNPTFNHDNWYESMKKHNPNGYKAEIDLERTYYDVKITKCKTVIKSFRFEEPTLDKIAKRLIQTDKNLSEYIRDLISKDLDDNFINIDFDKKE